MKVKELIEILSKVNGDIDVKCTWEGTTPDIHGIYIEDNILYIDSDGCFYAPDELLYKHKSIEKVGDRWQLEYDGEE